MERVPQLVRRGKKDRRMGAPSELDWEAIEALRTEMRVELIQELIPLGLAEVGRVLDEEVERLAGPRHARRGEGEVIYRHGSNPGSVRLGGQRHPVRVPRVRGLEGEARLESYERLHWAAGEVDEGLFRKVLLGISCRDYEAAVEAVPGAIGLSKSTVSREFKKATARQLKAFQERELTELDVVALFLDGKTFANDEIVVALAVTMGGDKVFAGFVQTETENARVITSFLRSLKDRGLDLSGRSAGRDRRRQGAEVGSDDGVPGPGAYPALPMAQARECGLVPATHRAEGLACTSAASLRAAHLRGGEAGPESDAG